MGKDVARRMTCKAITGYVMPSYPYRCPAQVILYCNTCGAKILEESCKVGLTSTPQPWLDHFARQADLRGLTSAA